MLDPRDSYESDVILLVKFHPQLTVKVIKDRNHRLRTTTFPDRFKALVEMLLSYV